MHQELYDKALEAINELFSDTSVARMVTKDDLKALKDEIDTMIESLEE